MVISVINFVDYSLNQRAPAGHESVETPIGNESWVHIWDFKVGLVEIGLVTFVVVSSIFT